MAGLTCLQAHQEMGGEWNDAQTLENSCAESANSGGNRPLRDLSPGVSYDDPLSDWDAPEQVYHFSEGRKLLWGV
jgi:hypothetical protein